MSEVSPIEATTINLDSKKVVESLEQNGKYEEDGILLTKWEKDGNSQSLIGKINVKDCNFFGILNPMLIRDGYSLNSYSNGDEYLGFFSDNQKEKHGIYMFKPTQTERETKIESEYYFGQWKEDKIADRGVYLWLSEGNDVEPFRDFDKANFEAFVGTFKKEKFDHGTYLTKEDDLYHVYHGSFDTSGRQNGDNSFLYAAESEILLFGTFKENDFVKGYSMKFDDNGEMKELIKVQEDGKIYESERMTQAEVKRIKKIMENFRNIIMEKDYFGEIYYTFKKMVDFSKKDMADQNIFKNENYSKIFGAVTLFNKITIYNDIEKKLDYKVSY